MEGVKAFLEGFQALGNIMTAHIPSNMRLGTRQSGEFVCLDAMLLVATFLRWLLIVSDQKVVAGAWLNVVVHGGGNIPVSVGPNGRCVHVDTSTLKSDTVSEWGWECERASTLEAARSLLFIEVGECRAVVMDTCVRRLRNQEKCNCRWDIRENVGKETLSNVAKHLN